MRFNFSSVGVFKLSEGVFNRRKCHRTGVFLHLVASLIDSRKCGQKLLTVAPLLHILCIYSRCEVITLIIVISLQSDVPAYEQIKTQIKEQILSGALAADEPLTSMRQLARDLRVSVITTTRAYGDLESEGLIYTVPGRGCFVKNNANLVRDQYLHYVDETLKIVVNKGKAAGLTLSEFKNKLEEFYYDECDRNQESK